ncbi:ABC transporter ATP-binding protein [Sphaerisporangium krabiense]|uniref:ABC-type polar amino acid transport system ATPase subunit n=1 Tax=Sphaerisporangium krabiense TaxID=763782 RepID=A0A7W8Z1W3_9ACTN|nr:amino acid ABC transporter ATP-binding protein [Sphaerisporangium krabiense]MBB5625936.1 ABC-type polar amino acid transport system ATPase subunit [Sphaerisporangium krabiense]GII64739.1 ABC transporter ATP-binding protein [Sphaerisporangium krabiense]
MNAVAIEARGLHKHFGERQVLKSVDLTVRTGEVVAVMGPSGAGKTTLIRCLNMLERPEAGTIRVQGHTVNCSSPPDRRQRRAIRDIRIRTAMVFQEFHLFPHLTVLENVIEGPISVRGLPRSYAIEVGERLLARLGIDDTRDRHPARLSGGQRQRVAIARAMAMDPEVILFDEPTSALDPELGDALLGTMRGLAARGIAMVLVTHDVAFAGRIADRVVFMDSGYILEDHPPRVFFSNPSTPRAKSFLRLMPDADTPPPALENTS